MAPDVMNTGLCPRLEHINLADVLQELANYVRHDDCSTAHNPGGKGRFKNGPARCRASAHNSHSFQRNWLRQYNPAGTMDGTFRLRRVLLRNCLDDCARISRDFGPPRGRGPLRWA